MELFTLGRSQDLRTHLTLGLRTWEESLSTPSTKFYMLKFHLEIASRRSVSFRVWRMHGRLPRGSLLRVWYVSKELQAVRKRPDSEENYFVEVQPIKDILWLKLNHKDIFRINLKLILCVDFYVFSTQKYTKWTVHPVHSPNADYLP